MTADNDLIVGDKLPESYRWNLFDHFRERGEKSADILRGVLFAVAGASIYFVVNQNLSERTKIIVLLPFAIVMMMIMYGWDLQRRKSIKRFETLRRGGLVARHSDFDSLDVSG